MGHHVEIFTLHPHDSCICAICHDVFKDPTSFKENCGHTFCGECAKDIRSCPTCRKEVSGTVPNFFARETIGALEVKCPTQFEVNESNKRARGNEGEVVSTSDGCGWVGKCVDLGDHGKVCQSKLVTCEIEGCDHQCRRKDMKSHLSDDLIHHMKLMKDSADKKVESLKLSIASDYEKKVESVKLSITADYEKKMSDLKQAITSDYDKKIDSMNKKLKSADKEIKALKKKVSELEAKQSQANLPSDYEEDEDEGVKIKVEGCGIPEINGTYEQCGVHNRKPMFSKKGRWDGIDVGFKILLGGTNWWISCWYDEIGRYHGNFYKARTGPDEADLPPKDGWVVTHQGDDPPPRITVLGNDSE